MAEGDKKNGNPKSDRRAGAGTGAGAGAGRGVRRGLGGGQRGEAGYGVERVKKSSVVILFIFVILLFFFVLFCRFILFYFQFTELTILQCCC